MRTALRAFALASVVLLAGAGARAQTPMESGAGRITARSNVRLSLESVTGTSAARLQAIGHAVGAKIPDIRTCYEHVVQARATVTGTLRLRFALAEGRAPAVIETTSDEVHDAELVRCALGAVTAAPLTGIPRPAAAIVVLFFDNSAALGTAAMQEHREHAAATAVTTNANGDSQATGTMGTHDVEFTATGIGDASPELVGAVHRGVTDGLAGLLDCRRRAGRRASPAGVLLVTTTVGGTAITDATVDSTTVADTRAPACVVLALKRMRLPSGQRAGRVQLHLTFRGL